MCQIVMGVTLTFAEKAESGILSGCFSISVYILGSGFIMETEHAGKQL